MGGVSVIMVGLINQNSDLCHVRKNKNILFIDNTLVSIVQSRLRKGIKDFRSFGFSVTINLQKKKEFVRCPGLEIKTASVEIILVNNPLSVTERQNARVRQEIVISLGFDEFHNAV